VVLRSHQLEAADLVDRHFEEHVENLARHTMGLCVVRSDRVEYHAGSLRTRLRLRTDATRPVQGHSWAAGRKSTTGG
jgi:hypothetical protein